MYTFDEFVNENKKGEWKPGKKVKYLSLRTKRWKTGTLVDEVSPGRWVLDNGRSVWENDPDTKLIEK